MGGRAASDTAGEANSRDRGLLCINCEALHSSRIMRAEAAGIMSAAEATVGGDVMSGKWLGGSECPPVPATKAARVTATRDLQASALSVCDTDPESSEVAAVPVPVGAGVWTSFDGCLVGVGTAEGSGWSEPEKAPSSHSEEQNDGSIRSCSVNPPSVKANIPVQEVTPASDTS